MPSGSIKRVDEHSRRLPLDWRSRWKLEASLWTGILLLLWEFAPIHSFFSKPASPVLDWIAVGLAGIAVVTALQVKRRLSQGLRQQPKELKSTRPNPLSLREFLQNHGVRTFGSVYLYMPLPRQERHEDAWAWIDTLQEDQLIRGDPWHIKADHVKDTVTSSYPHLFEGSPTQFDVFRLDTETLYKIVGEEIV